VIDDRTCDAAATSAFGVTLLVVDQTTLQFDDGFVLGFGGAAPQQRIDEETVALVGRHAPGRGVRRAHETELLEVCHDVTHGSRAQQQAGIARQGPRADRQAFTDIALDQHPQQVSCALAQLVFGRVRRHLA
jgi:hypothetical protein